MPPRTRERASRGIVIRDDAGVRHAPSPPHRRPSPSCRRLRNSHGTVVKQEPKEERDPTEDDPELAAVMASSLNAVQPADLQLDMESACAWSRDDWAETELQKQLRLLQETTEHRHVQRRRQAGTAAL